MISHLNKKNKPMIVDISKKKNSNRIAIAQGLVRFSKAIFKKIEKMNTKKGEITNVAIIAGILGAKKTSDLIPLCHHVTINKIDIDIKPNIKDHSLIIKASVKSSGKTGVEMEALTAVSLSCLTIYDMCKNLDKSITIDQIKLLKKGGGKSDFKRA